MGDSFGRTSADVDGVLLLSNGGSAVFLDVLALAACDLAASDWELHFALLCCDSRMGGGNDGFDLDQLAWTENWQEERAFVLRVVEAAQNRYHWDRLWYEPPHALTYLARYRDLVADYTPQWPLPDPIWLWTEPRTEADYTRCPNHGLFQGPHPTCRLCNPYA